MALAPTSNSGVAALFQTVGQGSQKLDASNTNLQAAGITTQTQAQALNQAYNTLLGVGTNDGTLQQAAGAAVYQPLDGYTAGTTAQGSGLSSVTLGTAATPTDFNLPPEQLSPASFNSWSSGFQKQYIDRVIESQISPLAVSAGATDYKVAGGYVQIGASSGSPINVVITPSQDATGKPIYSGGSIYVIENLTKTSFATMTSATQALIAGYDTHINAANKPFATIAASINLNTVGGVVVPPMTARSTQISAINTAIYQILQDANNSGIPISVTPDNTGNTSLVNNGSLVNAQTGTSGNGSLISGITYTGQGSPAQNPKGDGRLLCFNDVLVFVNELLNLQKQLLNMSVFAADSIQTQIDTIQSRYKTISAFGNIPNQFSAVDTSPQAVQSGAGLKDALGLETGLSPLRVNVVSTDVADTASTATNTTYYIYQVQSYGNTGDPLYNSTIQNQTQNYNNDPANKDNKISAGDWILVDSSLTLYDFTKAQSGNGPVPSRYNAGNAPYPYFLWSRGGSPAPSLGDSGNLGSQIVQGKPLGVLTLTQTNQPIAQSNQSTISSGYQKMIQAERQTLALQNQMAQVASAGTLANSNGTGNKALDVPNLIFLLQLYTNLIDEQQNASATEVVNQQNNLLNTYSQMQAMVNAVQGKFDATKQTEQRDIFGNLTNNNNNNTAYTKLTPYDLQNQQGISQAQMNVLSMFDKNLGDLLSPIEKLYGISRPTQALFDDANKGTGNSICYTATAWNSFGTSLSSAVTQINQQTQIQMNNIDTLNKEKDQHFNLANNCLSKLTDILSAIGRNLN